jgi:hypothetical protein
VSKQAAAKWRRTLGIPPYGREAPRAPVSSSSAVALEDAATPDRLAYLEAMLRQIHADLAATTNQSARASMYTAALKVRRDLDELRKTAAANKARAPASLAEQVVHLKRDCQRWPHQLLEAVVEIYCARYRLELPRTPLRTVGGTS